jgi:hypothetical protein
MRFRSFRSELRLRCLWILSQAAIASLVTAAREKSWAEAPLDTVEQVVLHRLPAGSRESDLALTTFRHLASFA